MALSAIACSQARKHRFESSCEVEDQTMTWRVACVARCTPSHGINDPGFLRPARSMSMIGG